MSGSLSRARQPLGVALLLPVLLLFAAAAHGEDPAAQEPYPDLEALFALYQPYADNITAYEPIYILVGTEPDKSKFQVSLKYRLFNPQGSLTRRYPWVQGLHLAYTQISFWDLESSSAPFEDTSYKPEIFYLSANICQRPAWLQGLFLQGGLQHESNGRGEDLSRSTNFLYLRPVAIFYDPDTRLGMLLGVKGWTYVNNSRDHNPDLYRYRGYFELETKLGKADALVVGSTLRWAKEGASLQIDATYPVHRLFLGNLDLYLQLQYTNALAESLLDYRRRTEVLRLGFAIVR